MSSSTAPPPACTTNCRRFRNVFAPDALAYDMVYSAGLTPSCARPARKAGMLADGLGMLVESRPRNPSFDLARRQARNPPVMAILREVLKLTWRLGRIALALGAATGIPVAVGLDCFVLEWNNPAMTSFARRTTGALSQPAPDDEFVSLKHQPNWGGSTPNHSAAAQARLVASEDAKFCSTKVLTGKASRPPGKKNLAKGASSLAVRPSASSWPKPVLSSQRTPWRKAEEAVITVMLEAVMDKRRILKST